MSKSKQELSTGKLIEAKRKELGVSRYELAKAIDMSYPNLFRIEKGQRWVKTVNVDTLKKIAEYLGVQYTDLMPNGG